MEDDFFHVPQQSRRHKLRFHDVVVSQQQQLLSPLQLHQHQHDPTMTSLAACTATTTGLNLSLSTHARSSGAYTAAPVGPFTGYASILGRSRFLRPAQELLEDFSVGHGVTFDKQVGSKFLEDCASWFGEDDVDERDHVSRRCSNPNLVSLLHEVYKRYKLYCQQMQSAVTSFESVAGLGNAAPFILFAVRAMFRHFHCLKNAILDQIRVASKGFGGVELRRPHTSGSCSEDRGRYDQKQVLDPNFLQHPVWRSQRGFPDKAVAVLRTWLFEHFLHPYPSDSDKQMLAQKTGLSRSQVSNWFTNARVRLWKPMVEEMHALERKTECSKAADTSNLITLSADDRSSLHHQLSENNFQAMNTLRDQGGQCKRSRTDVYPREEQSKEQFGLPFFNRLHSNQVINYVEGNQIGPHPSHSSALGNDRDSTTGLSWSTQGQIVPFWLARQ